MPIFVCLRQYVQDRIKCKCLKNLRTSLVNHVNNDVINNLQIEKHIYGVLNIFILSNSPIKLPEFDFHGMSN